MRLRTDNFKSYIDTDKVVLVDFYASWCGPCKMIMPTVNKLRDAYEGSGVAKVAKVDVEECPELTTEYNIKTLPTLILFKNGIEQNRITGRHTFDVLEGAINALISKN